MTFIFMYLMRMCIYIMCIYLDTLWFLCVCVFVLMLSLCVCVYDYVVLHLQVGNWGDDFIILLNINVIVIRTLALY